MSGVALLNYTDGKIDGIREGIKEGIKEGEAKQLVINVENAIKNFHITLEEACEGLGTTVGCYEEAKKTLPEE